MKTIIFVHNVEFPQQGAVDIFYYAKYLSQYGDIKVKVIVSTVNDDISNDNLEVIALGKLNYLSFVRQAFGAIKKIKKKSTIDYVYFFAQHPASVFLQLLTTYILKLKTIYDVVSGPIGQGFVSQLARQTIKLGVYLSTTYVVLDQGLIATLDLPNRKLHTIIPMGYDADHFKPQDNRDLFHRQDGDVIFSYIGTLDTTRNLEVFVQAFVANIDKHPYTKLYIIGSGNGEPAIRTAAGSYLDSAVVFLGRQPHHMIPDYIASSDILVSYVPKVDYYEYQPPTKLIEYLACNKPVMATNTIAQSEILISHPELIHCDDLASTTKQIDYVITHLDELQTKNYTDAVSEYSWEKLVERLKKMILQIN